MQTRRVQTRRVQTFPPPRQFSINTIIIEITSLGIKHVTFLHVVQDSSITVARGNTSLCDCEAGIASLKLPGVKNTPQSTKIAIDDGTISIIVTKSIIGEEGRRHPPATRLPTPSQDSPQLALYPILCWQGLRNVHHQSRAITKILTILHRMYAIIPSTAAAPSCCPIIPQIDAKVQ